MKAKWFHLTAAKANGASSLRIFGEIGWDVGAKSLVDELDNLSGDLEVHINSVGGNIAEGLVIYHALNQFDGNVTVIIEGFCASIASVIAMAGNPIEMHHASTFMIHNPSTFAGGEAKDLEKAAEMLGKMRDTMISAYLRRTNLSEDELKAAMDEETWYTPEEALEAGFIDTVLEADVDMAACAKEVDLTKFSNLPKEFATPVVKKKAARAAKTVAHQGDTIMTPEEIAAKAKADKEVQAAAKKAAIEEYKKEQKVRAEAITAAFKPFPQLSELQASCLKDADCTPDSARQLMLAKLGEESTPTGRVILVEDARDKRKAGFQATLLSRAGIKKDETSNEFRGYTLLDMARACVQAIGQSTAGLRGIDIAKAAFSNSASDFPFLLENTGNKVLLAAYLEFEATWQKWCETGQVSDFKDHRRIRLGAFNNLPLVMAGEEFKHTTFGEERETVAADTYGQLISVDRQMIINDDLGGLTRMARMQGTAAARTVDVLAYTVLNDNANMADGNALFSTAHSNKAAAGAKPINVANISAAKAAMRKQKFNSTDTAVLDIRAVNLLVPVEREDEALTFVRSVTDPDQANSSKPNIHKDSLEVIASPYHTNTTQYYLSANPLVAPTVEVVFLDGVQEPFLDSQDGFSIDGVTWKVRLDVGAKATDYRGMRQIPGA